MTIQSKRPSLLIVDDEEDIRYALEDIVKSLDSNIFQAENGEKALEILRVESIDAVLTDIKMPIMDGLELLSQMRQLRIMIPVVVLTAYGDRGMVIKALKLGAMDFLDKPFNEKNLISVVKDSLAVGVKLRSIETDLDELSLKYNIPQEKISYFKGWMRPLWVSQKENEILNKKKES